MRVLVAEDNAPTRSMLLAALAHWGFETVAAEDGDTAWNIMQASDAPRLVLLDWTMPGVDGIALCRRIRQIPTSDPPYIILLTARNEKEDIVAGLEAGASDYVTKPHDNAELRARLDVGKRMLELQTALNAARNALAYEASHDSLTTLLNRVAILKVVAVELNRTKRVQRSLSLAILDIDHFKEVNDKFGHQSGDDILVGFAERLKSKMRDYDALGRYGGEEFVVVAPDGNVSEGNSCPFERMRAAVADKPFATRSGAISITVSIGYTTTLGEHTVDQLLAAADTALYIAKGSGRNQVAYQKAPEQCIPDLIPPA